MLLDALHATRSLLCTATNATPHELFLGFCRKSPSGKSLPAWLMGPGPVLLPKHVRTSKHDDLTEKVELLEANPLYASVRHTYGREHNVSLSDVAPCPQALVPSEALPAVELSSPPAMPAVTGDEGASGNAPQPSGVNEAISETTAQNTSEATGLRRSTRSTGGVPPVRYGEPISFQMG